MQRTSLHLESLKDIPGYKAIIKAVLHSQIQQLVEQLSQHAEEEAVFLTASLGDGSISDLGSGIGKDFLQEKDDVKSQFLRFCLKRHHMIKTDEKSGQSIEPRPVRVTRATCSPRPRHTPYVSSPRGQKRVSGGTSFVTPSSSSVNIFSNDENQTESSVNEIKQESICIQLADNHDNDDNCDNYGGGVGADMDDYELAAEGVCDEFADDHKHNSKPLETCMSGTERNTPQSNVVGRETLMTTQGSLTSHVDDPVDTDRDNNFTVKLEGSGLHESDIKPVEMEHGVVHSETVSDMSFGTGLDQSGHYGYSGAAGTSADIQGNNSLQFDDAAAPVITYSSLSELERPSMYIKKNGRYCCDVCDYTSNFTHNLRSHLWKSHQRDECKPQKIRARFTKENGVFVCEQCSFTSKHSCNLIRHINIKHKKQVYKCGICNDKTYSNVFNLKEHIICVHENRKITCELCGKQCNARTTLYRHLRKDHGSKRIRKHHCKICDLYFTEGGHYDGHMNMHTGKKPHMCDICGNVFRYVSSLTKHRVTCPGVKMPRPPKEKIICDTCGAEFTRRSTLVDHIQGKHGKMDKVCTCGKTFRWRNSYSRHMQTCNVLNDHP